MGQDCSASFGGEACDGVDNNADGTVDRDPSGAPLRQACSSACGQGESACVNAAWTECSARLPTAEICDGLDNNCDGQVDETCACVDGLTESCGPGVGTCAGGQRRCVAGTWTECEGVFEPSAEVCDGIDNDCNGTIDEGCSCNAGETQACGDELGACQPGLQTCEDSGSWGPCMGAVLPQDELCDGIDNNCNGQVDEYWPNDLYEANNTSSTAAWLPTVFENGPPIILTPTLSPAGDEDWFMVFANETESDWCVPGFSEDDYKLTVALVIPTSADPYDYQLCLTVDEQAHCSVGADFNAYASEYRLGACWDGTCGADDNKQVLVSVKSSGALGVCGDYSLRAELTRPGVCN